jgi:hypothetical protein
MKEEYYQKSKNAAAFFFNVYEFYRDISLLMKEFSREINLLGYKCVKESYQLEYTVENSNIYDGFSVNKGLIGRFYSKETLDINAAKNHFSYGILFNETKPDSLIKPWIPIIYFLKGETKETGNWDAWNWNRKILKVISKENSENFLIGLSNFGTIEKAEIPKEILNVFCIKIPLGAMSSSEDVSLIVRPVLTALKEESESCLYEINDYLIKANEKISY